MSGFDEEAERERLREKYEQDEENRASTQRMSELLLKGATMTNSHCDACGDPLFRYDGQTFCPTCQAADAEAETADAEAESADSDADQTAQSADAKQTAQPTSANTDKPADETAPPTGQPSSPTPTETTSDGVDTRPTDAGTNLQNPRATARDSLSRTLVKYARAAEETDDPRRAKELLAAAREAAEALAALD